MCFASVIAEGLCDIYVILCDIPFLWIYEIATGCCAKL